MRTNTTNRESEPHNSIPTADSRRIESPCKEGSMNNCLAFGSGRGNESIAFQVFRSGLVASSTTSPTSSNSKEDTYSSNTPKSQLSFRIPVIATALLLASGSIHLALFAILGTSWHGPLSLRKPALFGISGGLTMWSIAWLMTQLRPKKFDGLVVNSLSIALLIEVALITLQYWRGVPSHFNHSTSVDGAIEFTMLGLILFVSIGIIYLTWRTFQLREVDPAMAVAIRNGMVLLAMSCLLGIATSVLGEVSLSAGRSYELWRTAGVLKFPHGVALHAIQMLPVVACLARSFGLKQSVRVVKSALAAQLFFLVYAVWQTGQGRDRFDWDVIGGCLLGLAVLFGLYTSCALFRGFIRTCI
jgi:hypothetical protein